MSNHTCPECGTDRTDILARMCETCHQWAAELDVDYEEWRDAHQEEDEPLTDEERAEGWDAVGEVTDAE